MKHCLDPHPVPDSPTEASELESPFNVLYRSLCTVFRAVVTTLKSMTFAVSVLVWLLIAIIVGVFLPQESLVATSDIKRLMGVWYYPVKALGGYEVFASAWFLWIQVLLLCSVTLGSWQWLLGAWQQATRTQWASHTALNAPQQHTLSWEVPGIADSSSSDETTAHRLHSVLVHCTQYFKRMGYEVFPQAATPHELYATKARWARLGPHITHVGIIVTLLAALYGYLTGFKAQTLALPKSSFLLASPERMFYNAPEGLWLGKVPNWVVEVEDFHVDYYPEAPKTAKNYFTTLRVHALATQANEAFPLPPQGVRHTISVNQPLKLPHDVTVYQASYEATGNILLSVEGKPLRLTPLSQEVPSTQAVMLYPLSQQRTLIIFPFIAEKDNTIPRHRIEVFMYQQGKGVLGFPSFQRGVKTSHHRLTLFQGQTGVLEGIQLKFIAPEMKTGLQIKCAPEVPWMYLGFLLLSLGVCVSFIPQRQVWVRVSPCDNTLSAETTHVPHAWRITLYPKTRKGWGAFLQELGTLRQGLTAHLTHANASLNLSSSSHRG
ncbi:MAG: cytochrome c biogenesis protein ResB [Vampirovibrionales bacterium]